MSWTPSDGLLGRTGRATTGAHEWASCFWHTMMSLDGFTAGPNDDMSWVFGLDAGSGETADEVVASTGALLVGRRT